MGWHTRSYYSLIASEGVSGPITISEKYEMGQLDVAVARAKSLHGSELSSGARLFVTLSRVHIQEDVRRVDFEKED